MDEKQKEIYRNQLLEAEQKIGEGYDKTLITLSGGALAISIAFINDVVGTNSISNGEFLAVAWSSWALSLTSLLLAFYFGGHAYRHAIETLDSNKLNSNNPGGKYSTLTKWLNAVGGLSFLVGVVTFLYFCFRNIGV